MCMGTSKPPLNQEETRNECEVQQKKYVLEIVPTEKKLKVLFSKESVSYSWPCLLLFFTRAVSRAFTFVK